MMFHNFQTLILTCIVCTTMGMIMENRELYDNSNDFQWIATLYKDSDHERVKQSILDACSLNTMGVYENNEIVSIADEAIFFHFDCDEDTVQQLIQEDIVQGIESNMPMFVQKVTSWGLDRIDQENLPLDNSFSSNWTGKNVNIYIVDTGVVSGHSEFSGRYTHGLDTVNEGNGKDDLNGHGTHCAGTAGGSTFGIARDANIYGVKVLAKSGSGSTTNVIKGIEWAVSNQKTNFGGETAVISLSLGGSGSSINSAVTAASKAGHIVTVAAGNSNTDACNSSPSGAGGNGRNGGVITVMSSDKNDRRSSFSSYGKCTDIIAPGTDITSSWLLGSPYKGTRTISGTSMATPHVAGVAAVLLEKHNKRKQDAVDDLFSSSVYGKISDAKESEGSKNLLLQVSKYSGPPTVAPTFPPTYRLPEICAGDFCPEYFISTFSVPNELPRDYSWGGILYEANPPEACESFSKNSMVDKVVIVKRGTCMFYDKVMNAQAAGAKAVIIYNDVSSVPFPPAYNGDASKVKIMSGMVSKADGAKLIKHVGETIVFGSPDFTPPPTTPFPTANPTPPTLMPTKSPTVEPTPKPTLPCDQVKTRKECKKRKECVFRKNFGGCIDVDQIPTSQPSTSPVLHTPIGCIETTFESAVTQCVYENMKICSPDQLINGETANECGFDDEYVWSSKKCGKKRFLAVRKSDGETVCKRTKKETAATRCC